MTRYIFILLQLKRLGSVAGGTEPTEQTAFPCAELINYHVCSVTGCLKLKKLKYINTYSFCQCIQGVMMCSQTS